MTNFNQGLQGLAGNGQAALAPAQKPESAAGRYLPAVLAVIGVWLLLRGLRKSFWTLFGLFWAVRVMW